MSSPNFERIFEPIARPDGSMFWEYSDTYSQDIHQVWSAMDGDNGETYLAPGYHVVNVFAFIVTKKPWTDADLADLTVKW